jgi:hypothetical protein
VSLKKASGTVKETSATADKILKDVVAATKSMTTSSGECLSTFETFIIKEGKITQDNLGVHFKELDDHFASQRGGLAAMGATSNQVGQHKGLDDTKPLQCPDHCTHNLLLNATRLNCTSLYYTLLYSTLLSPQYGEESKITLGTTGATPKKTLFSELEALVRTRDHDVIRNESRNAGKPPKVEEEEEEQQEEGGQQPQYYSPLM